MRSRLQENKTFLNSQLLRVSRLNHPIPRISISTHKTLTIPCPTHPSSDTHPIPLSNQIQNPTPIPNFTYPTHPSHSIPGFRLNLHEMEYNSLGIEQMKLSQKDKNFVNFVKIFNIFANFNFAKMRKL